MSLHAEKLTGSTWTVDPTALPEAMVDLANTGARGVSNNWLWADRIPAVHVSRLTDASPRGVDVATGNFVPRPVLAKWSFDFGKIERHSGLALDGVELQYVGPSNFHNSAMGTYYLTLVLDSPGRRRPPFHLDTAYFVELLMNGNRRPMRISGEGQLANLMPGNKHWRYNANFVLDGSFHPERNTHLRPAPVSPVWAGNEEDDEPVVRYIDVPRSKKAAVRRTVGRRNIGVPNQD